jgi:hypothetical protein
MTRDVSRMTLVTVNESLRFEIGASDSWPPTTAGAARTGFRDRRGQRRRTLSEPAAGLASNLAAKPADVNGFDEADARDEATRQLNGSTEGLRDGGGQLMEPQGLRTELESRGLTVLGVGQHRQSPEILVVYLHGNAGQWVDGAARRVIASVPGVATVAESVQSPSILLVRLQPIDGDGPS